MRDSFDIFYDKIEQIVNEMEKEEEFRKNSEYKRQKINSNSSNQKEGETEEDKQQNERIQNHLINSNIVQNKYSDIKISQIREANRINLSTQKQLKNIIIEEFTDLHLNLHVFNKLKENHISKPTPIQMQIIPYFLSGLNVFGQSPTGTGKTLCFILPLVLLKMKKRSNYNGAVVLVPTRELCLQVKKCFEQFIKVFCLYGGTLNDFHNYKSMEGQIIVATPGRLLQMVEKKNFIRYFSHLVLDEIDKMTSAEFISNILKVKQKMINPICCVLAATCFDLNQINMNFRLDVQVIIGDKNMANENVKQRIVFCNEKFAFLIKNITRNALIFVSSKDCADEITVQLQEHFKQVERDTNESISIDSLHSGKDQIDRNKIIDNFHEEKLDVLVCTGLMSRGIDFKVNLIINYDCPSSIDDYIHQIGRTGRIRNGKITKGTACTLINNEDSEYVKKLMKFWKENNAEINPAV